MKRTRHSAEQIINKLRDASAMAAAGKTVAQIVQQLGVSEQTYHRWQQQYGDMKSDEAKRLRQLEAENQLACPPIPDPSPMRLPTGRVPASDTPANEAKTTLGRTDPQQVA